MSHGRAICGLGAGWYEHEWLAYGYGFPETRDRMGAFRDAVQIVVKMWTDEKATYHGKYHSVDGAINEPKGVQRPHMPLWLGGGGEKVTLKLVAQWADGCNVGGGDPVVVRQKLAVLREHCDKLGRDYNTITRSTGLNIFMLEDGADPEKATAQARGTRSFEDYSKGTFVATAAQITDRISELAGEGIDYIIMTFPRIAYDHSQLNRFAEEIMPKFQ
jgi:alkanesulfonate monooxygenase SsuD/methylene tetrahydromethanopterin reductase-like flavin-dependent oxidoreductase (luciferase family)